ncbi:MAG: hypothetical protein ACI4VW_04535 [Acutalibacteraceae bacterium]
MKILTKRNGIALVAVLTVLLVLTLLLPVMFNMTENALSGAVSGEDRQRASYYARSMVEMTVSAFEDLYDAAEEDKKTNTDSTYLQIMNSFKTIPSGKDSNTMKAQTVYIYKSKDPTPSLSVEDQDDIDEVNEYIKYFTSEDTSGDYEYLGKAECDIIYEKAEEYYETKYNAETGVFETSLMTGSDAADIYNTYIQNAREKGSIQGETDTRYSKLEQEKVTFVGTAVVKGKKGIRRCVMYLPSKPAEKNWIAPASMESNQIFPDTEKATSITNLEIPDGFVGDADAFKNQPVFIFSCVGNMVISKDNMKIKDEDGNYVDYDEFIEDYNNDPLHTADNLKLQNNTANFSLGLHPITKTLKPENDPSFSCVKTNNMRSWAAFAQRDNFVAYTATNAIEVDMPINLLINPCRTMRIGDGISANQSLYKILCFQAPDIVFKESVNSFMSLYRKEGLVAGMANYNAYRMSSIILSAPQSTPYSYLNEQRGEVVKAGKVYFMDDAYIWLIPYGEDGSDYNTQTVYYKGKDILLYKFANAGDVFLFNTEVKEKDDTEYAGFSMTGYFMDVLYNKGEAKTTAPWWDFVTRMRGAIFDKAMETFKNPTYVEEDLKWIGNIKSGTVGSTPVVDDFYVVWES